MYQNNYKSRPSEIHPKYSKLVQHIKIKLTYHKQVKEKSLLLYEAQ